jgi:transposase
MSRKRAKTVGDTRKARRSYTREFKEEAVRMLLDGQSARSICERLGLSGTNILYRWKRSFLGGESGIASDLEARVRELEAELRRVEREREILKKALSIFGRDR